MAFVAAHLIIFLAFHPMIGRGIAAFALLPAVIAGLLLGWCIGLIAGMVLTLLNGALLLLLFGAEAFDGIFAIGSLFILASGTAVGWLQQQLLRLRQEMNRANEMTTAANALRDGISVINSTLDLQEVLNKILLHLSDVIPHDAANIMLIEDDIGRVFHHRGYPEDEAENMAKVHLHISETPNLQKMIQTRQPVIITDTQLFSGWIRRNATSWTRAYVGAPISTRDHVIGFLNVNSATPNFFSQDHAAGLQAFADQVGLAIYNAQLLTQARQQTERLTSLLNTMRAASAILDLEDILRLVAAQIVRELKVTGCALSKWDRQANTVITWLDFGLQESEYLDSPGTVYALDDYPLSRQVLETAVPTTILVNDPKADPAEMALMKDSQVNSLYMFPLATADRVIGLVKLYDHEQARYLTADEQALCQAFLDQISVFVVNADLFDETRRQAQQLEALRQAGLSVTARLELPRVLQAISGAAMGLLPQVSGIHIYIYDAAEDKMSFGTVLWADGRTDTPYDKPEPGGLTYTIAHQGETIIMPDARTHPLLQGIVPEDTKVALAALPLKIGQRVVGVMVISRSQLGLITEADLEIVQLFADQAAIAIENARLYKQAQEEVEERKLTETSLRQRNITLELLAELSRAMTVPLSTNPILDSVAQLTGQALDFTTVYICDWINETGQSTVLAEYMAPEASPLEKQSDLGKIYNLAEDFEDTADWLQDADHYEVMYVDDPELALSKREHMEQYGVRSIITVPLWAGATPIGYLEGWESRYKREFRQDEIERLQAIARQVAMGIHNALLYDSVRKNEERFRLIFELAPTGMAIVTIDGRFQRVNQAFCNIVGYTAAELLDMTFVDITHPDDISTNLALDRQLLRGELPHFSMEKRYFHKEGHLLNVILQVALVKDDNGEPLHLVGQIIDITQRKAAEEQLRHNVFHDALTNLPNRALFLDHVQRAIGHTERQSHYAFAVLFLDLDRFKVINDSLGHAAGDELLKIIGQRLAANIRPGDTVARFGGDEFAVLLDGMQQIDQAQLVAEQILHSLSNPVQIAEHDIALTASIGITLSSSHRQKAEEYVRDADTAMYRAKEQGGNRFVIFDNEMYTVALERLRLETDLRQAMKAETLQVFYQPILSLPDGRMTKVECLLRWPHIQQGFISPTQFIPMAEETGLINPIGEWLMRAACKEAKKWQDMGYPIRIAINVSLRQFQYQDLPQLVKEILTETDLPATSLELEITESIAMSSQDFSTAPLQKLAKMGVHISVDDFGTGYSSLSRLKTLPISTLKIDRSFIMDLMDDPNDKAMVEAIIAMAHSLKLKVVAEGVETMDQLTFLWQQQCDQIQGYLVSPPLSSSDLLAFVEENTHISETGNGTRKALFITKEIIGE